MLWKTPEMDLRIEQHYGERSHRFLIVPLNRLYNCNVSTAKVKIILVILNLINQLFISFAFKELENVNNLQKIEMEDSPPPVSF